MRYKKDGQSDKCVDGKGGPWANSVYKLKEYKEPKPPQMESLGCWKDSWDRALPKLIKTQSWGMTPAQCLGFTEQLGKGAYTIFGVENGEECWAASNEKTYQKHGKSDACKNGVGGPWSLSVYKFKVNI